MAEVRLARGSIEVVRSNILSACFQASIAVNPDTGPEGQRRLAEKTIRNRLGDHRAEVDEVIEFLDQANDMAAKAMSCGIASPGRQPSQISKAGYDNVLALSELLIRYRAGLELVSKIDHPIHIASRDFQYGPFRFNYYIDEWKYKGGDIRHAGLMFHLSYLFRYFTCEYLPQGIECTMQSGLLRFYGPMLECGRPHTEIVSALVDAVFKCNLSPERVRDRLRDLGRGASKGNRRPRSKPQIGFVGWD
jgi:hypothetical protein